MAEYGFESKTQDESKSGGSSLDRIMSARGSGDVLANLYPFYQSKIAHGLDEFYLEHLDSFDPDEEENKLVYWDIFKEFERLFESYLDEFIEDQKIDRAEFREQLSEIAEGANQKSSFLVRMVAAQTDYDFFVNLMKDKAREARAASPRSSHK